MQQTTPARAMATNVPAMFHHGGNLKSAIRTFPAARQPWIDLSTGINPVPFPMPALTAAAYTRLPESGAITMLELLAGDAWSIGAAAQIVAAPGTQALIQWLPQLVSAKRVGILGFTYAEHAATWQAAGAEVAVVTELAELAAFDVAVIVNPNNPDGRLVPVADLTRLAHAMARRGGLLVVDEAFVDMLDPGSSLVPQLPANGAVVLRSFGKTYGLAGLRLGFAVAPDAIAQALRAALGPWAISGAAVEIGCTALADREWLVAARLRLAGDVARLDGVLARAGFSDISGTPLFRMARHQCAGDLFASLGAAGILVRPFTARPDMLRFGLPGPYDWARLEACLAG